MRSKLRPALPTVVLVAALMAPSAASAAWEEKPVSLPSGGTEGVLYGVSCFSESSCTATGTYFNGTIWGATGNEWKGASWSLASVVQNPGDKNGRLNSVHCFTSTKCWAVGSYGANGIGRILTEMSTSGTWSVIPAPAVSSAPQMFGVSCTTALGERCIAVGQYNNPLEGNAIIAMGWDGAKWSFIPINGNPGGQKNGILWSVSCVSPNSCRAVGGWGTPSGKGVAGEQFWNGFNWTASAVPEPTGATYGTLRGISCVAANSCIAVGSYRNSASKTIALAEFWNGSSWSLKAVPEPAGATATELLGVSCVAANSCRAVGTFKNSSGANRTLAAQWNGNEWILETSPNPTGSTASAWQGISCTGTEECQAVGWYRNSSGKKLPLAARL
jgi:hypothetical protein